ncbi:MAG: hypothetical protein U9R28_03085 [Pseudomonadota bacterium]|nr:hypothetical protein [Pseudomonadota bacterium]
MNTLNKTLLNTALLSLSFNSFANNNIDTLNLDSNSHFEAFAESLTNVYGHKSVFPAEQLGLLGFDIGVSANIVDSAYKLDSQVEKDTTIPVYSIHANKGLPGGIDLAFNYNVIGDSDSTSWSGEVKYALIEGGTAKPAVAVSGHYSQASGIEALDFSSFGIDLGVSKGFANLTPYAGVGYVIAEIDPTIENTDTSVNLSTQNVGLVTFNAGMNINFLVMDILVGYNQIGDLGTYSIKAGYRF